MAENYPHRPEKSFLKKNRASDKYKESYGNILQSVPIVLAHTLVSYTTVAYKKNYLYFVMTTYLEVTRRCYCM